jgi:hypothetical protein
MATPIIATELVRCIHLLSSHDIGAISDELVRRGKQVGGHHWPDVQSEYIRSLERVLDRLGAEMDARYWGSIDARTHYEEELISSYMGTELYDEMYSPRPSMWL